jgi:hypothetical protein
MMRSAGGAAESAVEEVRAAMVSMRVRIMGLVLV